MLEKNNACPVCLVDDFTNIELTKNMVVNPDGYEIPDIFPIIFRCCNFCYWADSASIKSDKFSAIFNANKMRTARDAHYHKTGWHFEYVTYGTVDYLERPIGSTDIPTLTVISNGQLFLIPPQIEHGLYFNKPSKTLTLANKNRPKDDLVEVTSDFINPITGEKIPRKNSYK